MNQSEKRLFLIQTLLNERPSCQKQIIPADSVQQKALLRGLMNVRRAYPIGVDFLQMQDAYLHGEAAAKGVTDIADLTPIQPGLYLWQGDITTLKCDAIVNAGTSGMTGCYIPNHRCIDNAIHTYAGVELRLACEELMEQQGYPESTGQAKITPAFNLPCRYVLHTVGSIINGRVTKEDEEFLASCPHCGKPMTMNLRCDDTFVEDEDWHKATERYENFLRTRAGEKIFFLELGVGYNTTVIIKYPFWQMTSKNPKATYACINQRQAACPQEIQRQSVCINADIGQVLPSLSDAAMQ